MNIENTQECFVQLWLRLERTRQLLEGQHKRFCVRNVLRAWFGLRANDDFIWEVLNLASSNEDMQPIYGYDALLPPALYPYRHREILRAIVALKLGIGMRKVDLHALDAAYSVAYPNSTPINVNKKADIYGIKN